MLFNSLSFASFLCLVFVIFWSIRGRFAPQIRNLLLIVASFVFYGWTDPRLCVLLGISATTAWACGRAAARNGSTKRWVVTAVAVNLGILGFFKYYNFFAESFNAILPGNALDLPTLSLVLPIGISFFSFMSISYVVDCHRAANGHNLAKKFPSAFLETVRRGNVSDMLAFFAYMSFFPQLLAGPIGRGPSMLPQFARRRDGSEVFDSSGALHGLCLIAYGLFKKMVVADTLCLYVDKAFTAPELYSSLTCLIGALFFTIQIYCDFSGYSDAARGVARLFGIELMLNFDRPYLATSFSDFWRRWHISLSTWFRDYLYIPLGGNRVSFARIVANTWIVFLVSGLWHGAAWTFVAWGGLHALYLTFGLAHKKLNLPPPKHAFLAALTTFVPVAFAWIFFRAHTFAELSAYLTRLGTGGLKSTMMQLCGGMGPMHFLFCWLAIALMALSYLLPRDCAIRTTRFKVAFILACGAAIIWLGIPAGGEFIYFQF